MASLEEDTYSIIFSALKHPSRRKIIRILGEGPNTYTELQNKLGVETGFLNYYLESLNGLVAKDEDGRYRISDLGRSALGLMKQVEEPAPRLESKILDATKHAKAVLIVFLLGMAAISGMYMDLNGRYNSQTAALQTLNSKIGEYTYLTELEKLVINNPPTRVMSNIQPGVDIVSGYGIQYLVVEGSYDVSTTQERVVFYNPRDDVAIRMSFFIYSSQNVVVPLTIQKGNAFLNESSVYVRTDPDNDTVWQSPVIWTVNATKTGTYEFKLPSKGWYTLSLTGPVLVSGGGYLGRALSAQLPNGTREKIISLQTWVDFQLLKDGAPTLFAIDERWW